MFSLSCGPPPPSSISPNSFYFSFPLEYFILNRLNFLFHFCLEASFYFLMVAEAGIFPEDIFLAVFSREKEVTDFHYKHGIVCVANKWD